MTTGLGPAMMAAVMLMGSVAAATTALADGGGQNRPAAPAATSGAGDPVRGRYLAEHVAMCVECHSGRDASGTIIPNQRYMGGALPPGPQWASDWPLRAPRNAGLAGYTDDEARRLLMRGAIDRRGVPLRAPMPRFQMTEQDANDVIAFLRTVP
ncbi:MAG: c-type cytochrome [Vicinamibacterales bacterium]